MFAKIDKHQVAVSKSKLRLPINVCWIIKRHVNYCHVYNKMTRQCQSSSYLQIHRNVDICPVFQNDVASHSESLSGVAGQYRLKDAQACKWSSNATTNDLRKWSPDCTTSRDRNGYKGKVWTHDWIWQWIWSLENRFFFLLLWDSANREHFYLVLSERSIVTITAERRTREKTSKPLLFAV